MLEAAAAPFLELLEATAQEMDQVVAEAPLGELKRRIFEDRILGGVVVESASEGPPAREDLRLRKERAWAEHSRLMAEEQARAKKAREPRRRFEP